MKQEVNNTTSQYPLTIEELVDDMEKHPDKFKHLQFVLSSKKNHNLDLGQKYLVVNSRGFGLYVLNSVDYSNCIITMIFTTHDTGNPAIINLDICNEHPDIYLINWRDVEDLVFTDCNCCDVTDELLGFDF